MDTKTIYNLILPDVIRPFFENGQMVNSPNLPDFLRISKVNPIQAMDILTNTIRYGLRHPNYNRTVEIADFSKAIMTGQGQDDLIIQYKSRESDAQKQQRIKLTKTLTKYAGNQILKFFKKVRRVDGISKNIETKSSNKSNLERKINNFGPEQSLSDYLFDTLEFYSFYDPNAWIVTERRNVMGVETVEDVQIYPFEVSSHQAINYLEEHGNVQWLIVEQLEMDSFLKDGKLVSEQISNFYFYAPGFVIHLKEYINNIPTLSEDQSTIRLETESQKERKFVQSLYLNGTNEVPAVQIGAYLDFETKKQTFVTPLEPAKEILEDLINIKSEFDLTKALHTFLQKIAYAPPCQFEDQKGSCQDGFIGGDFEQICPSCNGRGVDVHTTVQDVILIKMPDSKDGFLPLSELVQYVNLPDWLPKFQAEQIEIILKRVSLAVFNTEVFKKPEVAETATAAVLEWDKIYDVLAPFATQYSKIFKKIVRISAQYLGIKDVQLMHKFPADFKLKSVTELLAEYKSAKEAGLSAKILDGIAMDILQKRHSNEPEMVEMIKAENHWKPFADKSSEEVAVILSSRDQLDRDRILWENYDRIFKSIHFDMFQLEAKFFHLLILEKQKEILELKIEEIKASIIYSSNDFSFPTITDEEE